MIVGAPRRVLDIGCGAGMTATLIAEKFPGAQVIGVEPDADLAAIARTHVSVLVPGKIDDDAVFEEVARHGPYDLIVLADVLEHLAAPADMLARVVGLLVPDGKLVTSIPNVRHVSTFLSLGLLGTWPARDRGIHDRGHLRFFARKDIVALGTSAGLQVCRERRNLRLIESAAWSMVPAMVLDFWPLRGFLTFQYLHLWVQRRDFNG